MNFENLDIKDLVLIGGGLFTLAIIVHGLVLAWRSRQDPLRLEITQELIPDDEDELVRFRGELPYGGGRPVRPEQRDLDFEEGVPVLLDTVGTPAAATGETATAPPRWPDEDTAPTAGNGITDDGRSPIHAGTSDPVLPDTGPIVAQDTRRARLGARGEAESRRETRKETRKETPKETRATSGDAGGQELLVINLFAPHGEHFSGEALLAAMRAEGLRFGEMNIFHRFDPHTREIRFGVANVVEPGYFDLAEISSFVSPGLVFFLQLPGPSSPGDAMEDMIRITRSIADELGAVLKDENMNVLTPQTVEHYRERVADFSRRRLSRRVGAL